MNLAIGFAAITAIATLLGGVLALRTNDVKMNVIPTLAQAIDVWCQ